jgi:hypothetical protein
MEEEEIEQKGYNLGYNIADQLLDLLGEFSDEEQALVIKGFITGFNAWEIDELTLSETKK